MSPRAHRQSQKEASIRDAEATQASILGAAEEEFARFGLAGSRTESIASQSGVNKAMIYYYFQSKEGLYEATLSRIFKIWSEMIVSHDLKQLPPEEALIKEINVMIQDLIDRPQRVMILFHESTQNQGFYYRKLDFTKIWSGLISVLERGMAEGVFQHMDPFLTTINIICACEGYFLFKGCLQHIRPEEDLLSEEMIERHRQACLALILNGIKIQQS